MFSFRVDDDEAAGVDRWAGILGVGRSAFLREALHRQLVRLQSETDGEHWSNEPPTPGERAIERIADWGPSEDWSEWIDAAG